MKYIKSLLLIALLAVAGTVFAQDTIRVKVMTYNLRFGQIASLEEIASHIKSFNPDFVAIQEVDCMTKRDRAPKQNGKHFVSELAYRTNMFGLYGKTIPLGKGYYGIGILSKYPYISVNKSMLPWPVKKDEPRAMIEGAFEFKGDTVIFASTHLDVKLESTRVEQAKFLCEYFKDSKYPVILGGDFNETPDGDAIQKCMLPNWFNGTNSDLTYPAWDPNVKIDYLFGLPKEGWRIVKTQTVHSCLSDHLPIITELEYIKK